MVLSVRPHRKALALPLILAAVAALTVLAVAFVGFTQGQGRLTHRGLLGEAAYHLALSGVDVALAAVDARMRAGGALEAARDSLPAALEASTFELDSRAGGSALAALVGALDSGLEARAVVAVRFRGWTSLYPAGFRSPAGTLADPAEKTGFVEVVSRATCGGVPREVSCHKAARVIRPALPVLPRFTLFVKRPPEPGALALTEIEKRSAYPAASGRIAPGASHDALVLWNSASAYTPGGPASGWLDRAGWVFLGSPADGRWVFDLTYGGGAARVEGEPHPEPFGEDFLLTRQAMWVTSDAQAAGALRPPGQELLRAEFDRLVMRTGLHAGLCTEGPLFAKLPPGPERGRVASLHLFGSGERPSPTVVLGRVYRRSLITSYLGTKAHDRVLPLPYVHAPPGAPLAPRAADWAFAPAPDGTPPLSRTRVVRDLFGDRVSAYSRFMSRAVIEPYARSFDHVEKNLTAPTAPDAFDPPYALLGVDRLTRRLEPLDGDPGRKRTFLYAVDANARVRLLAADRRTLFEGDLGELAPVDLLLPERTTHVFRAADFRRWTAAGRLRVRGIMALDPAEPDLAIDRPLEVEEGGVLVVRGSIDISAPITAAPGARRPLVLVALEGRIRVRAPHVHACLVALGETGVVERAGDADLEIKGQIAASRLDVASLARGVAAPARISKSLTYDERSEEPRSSAPAFYMDRRRVVVVR